MKKFLSGLIVLCGYGVLSLIFPCIIGLFGGASIMYSLGYIVQSFIAGTAIACLLLVLKVV